MSAGSAQTLYPLIDFIDRSQIVLSEFVDKLNPDALNAVMVADAWTEITSEGFTLSAEFFLDGLGELSLPGLEQFALSFDQRQPARGILVCGPEPSLTIEQIGLTLRVDPAILARSDKPDAGATIRSTCGLRFDRDGFHFLTFTEAVLDEARIAGTDVKIKLDGIALDGKGDNLFSVRKATLTLPMFEHGPDSLTLECEKLALGRSGPSGVFCLADGAPIDFSLYDFNCELKKAAIELRRGQLVGVDITGRLDLSAFLNEGRDDGWVDVSFSVGPNGAVAALSDGEPVVEMHVKEIFALKVDTIRLEKGGAERDGTLWLSGELTPEIDEIEGSWPSFAFDEIGISAKGDLRWGRGAGIATTQPFVARWNFLRLTVTAFSLGRPPEGGLELSISAGVEILQGLPAGTSVEGLVVRQTPGDGVEVRFNGIRLIFSTPGAFAVDVKLVWDPDRKALSGSGHLDIQAIEIRMDVVFEAAAEKVNGERVTSLFFAAQTDLVPGGIPIGTTGLSLYAISGLLAYNKAIKLDSAGPRRYFKAFQGNKQKNIEPGFAQINKWDTCKGHHALGLGVVIGTSDDGWMFSARGALLLTIPDFVLLITASAELMQERPSMTSANEGVLSAVLAVIPAEKLVRLDFGAEWKSPPLFEAGGEGGGEFRFDQPFGWKVWLGLPPKLGDPVYARAVQVDDWLIQGDFYYVLDAARSAQIGARSRFERSAGGDAIYAELIGEIGGDACLSWQPAQFEGEFLIEARGRLSGAGVTLGFNVSADPHVNIARPLAVVIPLKACVELGPKWSPIKICLQFSFAWLKEEPPQLDALVQGLTAVPRHWNPRVSAPGTVDDGRQGVVTAVGDLIDLGEVHPHSELVLEFGKPMLVALNAPPGAPPVHLNEQSVPFPELIGANSRWKQQWTLDGMQLKEFADAGAAPVEIFGTFQQSPLARDEAHGPATPRLPNTQLRLLSSRRFGEDGSLGGGFEKVPRANCEFGELVEPRCISLAALTPGFGQLSHGWRYEWRHWAAPGAPLDNLHGVGLLGDDSFFVYPPAGITLFDLHRADYQPGKPPANVQIDAAIPGRYPAMVALGRNGQLLLKLCWLEIVAADGTNRPAGRSGSSGVEEWTIDADKWLLRPGRRYKLSVTTSGHLLKATDRYGPSQQRMTRHYSFTARRAPDWPFALARAVAGVYPSDGERPAYRDYDLLVHFRDSYFETLYRLDKRRLAVRLRDANGDSVTGPDGREVLLPVAWENGTIERSPIERWWGEARASGSACEGGSVPPTDGKTVLPIKLKDLKLKPLTPYSAELVAVDDDAGAGNATPALYGWIFTTSRFHDFPEMAAQPTTVPALGLAQLRPPPTNDFDGLIRAFDAPVVTLAETMRMTPVRQGNSLAYVLIEAPEPLDDSSNRLTIIVEGQSARLHRNLDNTRIIAALRQPIALTERSATAEVTLDWRHFVNGVASETRRTIGGAPQDARCAWRLPLGGLF